mmetsp:Transcript_6498/g.14202  ORF Transcript_6498/g.14202 Transcript_6498/m.14202 type:complete len:338 (-) Transcript_6498:95-1108(-)
MQATLILLLGLPCLSASASAAAAALPPAKASATALALRAGDSSGRISSSPEAFVLAEDVDALKSFYVPTKDSIGDTDEDLWKSNEKWWQDPLSHFDSEGNEIMKQQKKKGIRNPFRRAKNTGKREVTTKPLPIRNQMSRSSASSSTKQVGVSVNPVMIVLQLSRMMSNPLVLTSAVVLYLKYKSSDDVWQRLVSIKESMAAYLSESSDPVGLNEEVAAISSTTRKEARPKGFFGSIRSTKEEEAKDEVEAQVRTLLARAINAERKYGSIEHKYDLLKEQLQEMKKLNTDLYAHLKQTRKMSDDMHNLSEKVDKLSTYVGILVSNSNMAAGQRVYGRA